MYADDSLKFRQFLTNYCNDLNIPFPKEYSKRKEMRLGYKADIKLNDVPDDECSLMSWLDEVYLPRINEEKKMIYKYDSICAIETKVCAPVPMPCEPAPWKAAVKKKMAECCNQEKEDTMNYNEIEASRKYLNQRVSDIFYAKERDLTDTFKLRNSERPQTYQQLIDAIKNGNYELDTKKTAQIDGYVADEGYYFGSMTDGIVWKLPDGPDREGFAAAMKAAKAALTAAKDVINTQDSAAGLKALQDFEAWTYTAPAQ